MNKDDSIRLTPREQEVMQWSADGKSCSDIGVILGVVQAVAECIRRGLIR